MCTLFTRRSTHISSILFFDLALRNTLAIGSYKAAEASVKHSFFKGAEKVFFKTSRALDEILVY